jgi:hypothetical protein
MNLNYFHLTIFFPFFFSKNIFQLFYYNKRYLKKINNIYSQFFVILKEIEEENEENEIRKENRKKKYIY